MTEPQRLHDDPEWVRTHPYGDDRDYPFDETRDWRDVYELQGLDKLRCVSPDMPRQALYELYFAVHNRKQQPEDDWRAKEATQQKLVRLASQALQGALGDTKQLIARQILIDQYGRKLLTPENLTRLEQALSDEVGPV